MKKILFCAIALLGLSTMSYSGALKEDCSDIAYRSVMAEEEAGGECYDSETYNAKYNMYKSWREQGQV